MKTIKEYNQTQTGYKVAIDNKLVHTYNKAGEIFHFLDLNYIGEDIFYHGWIGFRTNEQIKEVLEGHFLDFYKKYKPKKMLIENSKMTGSFYDLNEWLSEEFMPKMVEIGLTHNAVVFPYNVFAQLSVDDWDKKVGGFHNRSFHELEVALKWLRSE